MCDRAVPARQAAHTARPGRHGPAQRVGSPPEDAWRPVAPLGPATQVGRSCAGTGQRGGLDVAGIGGVGGRGAGHRLSGRTNARGWRCVSLSAMARQRCCVAGFAELLAWDWEELACRLACRRQRQAACDSSPFAADLICMPPSRAHSSLLPHDNRLPSCCLWPCGGGTAALADTARLGRHNRQPPPAALTPISCQSLATAGAAWRPTSWISCRG